MRRRSAALSALAALTGVLALLTPSPVAAQTGGYPPGLCNVLTGAQDLGNVAVGQQLRFQLAPQCIFTPGATVSLTANGVAFTKIANAAGFVDLSVNVISETQFEINPVVPARCGVNTIVGTGPSAVAGGRQVTQTATFNLVCRGAVAKPATPPRRLSLTGDNVARWGASALVLLLMGAALVTVGRRRASARN